MGSGEGAAEGRAGGWSWARGRWVGGWGCRLFPAAGLDTAPSGAKVVALRPPATQQRLPASAGQVKTPGRGGFLHSHRSFCTPAGHFCRHLRSFGIKGIRVIKCILRLQLQHKKKSLGFEGRDVLPFLSLMGLF